MELNKRRKILFTLAAILILLSFARLKVSNERVVTYSDDLSNMCVETYSIVLRLCLQERAMTPEECFDELPVDCDKLMDYLQGEPSWINEAKRNHKKGEAQ